MVCSEIFLNVGEQRLRITGTGYIQQGVMGRWGRDMKNYGFVQDDYRGGRSGVKVSGVVIKCRRPGGKVNMKGKMI